MSYRFKTPEFIRIVLIASSITTCLGSGLEAVETLALNRTLSSGASATGSTSFVDVASVTNSAGLVGDVTVVASFSADPAGGSGGRAGEWRLVAAVQQSMVVRRDMSDSSSDFGVMNLAWTFSNLASNTTVTLQHRTSVAGRRIATQDITLVTIPMTTEPSGVDLDHDLDSQGIYIFTSAATDFVPVEKAAGSSLVATVQVAPMSVPRDVFVAATFSTSKPVAGAADATWKLQYNNVNSPPTDECQDGTDVGTAIQRSLGSKDDVGAVMLYAIAENLDPGTYEFRLCAASPSTSFVQTFGASLLAFSLHFVGNGVGGHFPRIQATVAQTQATGGNMELLPGLFDPFTLAADSDVFLAMNLTAFTTTSGQGDFGEFETCIEKTVDQSFPFGNDQNGSSQEVRRRFSSGDDLGAAGQVGLAINLAAGDYNARGCASVTGNPVTLVDPNLVGFVPSSIDDTTVPVSLAWFRARGGDLEWATATEVGNLGFHIYGVEEGQPRRLNGELIRSRALDAISPTFYRFRAAGFAGDTFFLEDVDITGRSRFHGPFRRGNDDGKGPSVPALTDWRRIERQRLARAHLQGVGRSRGMSLAGPRRSFPAVNIGVDRDGIHRLRYEDLMAAGLDLGGVPVAHLALKNRGRPVQIRVESRGRFGRGSYIEFIGQALDTLYTRTNVYNLVIDPRSSARIERDRHFPPVGEPPKFYRENRKVETNRLYDFSAPGESPWYDSRLLAISEPVEETYALEIDARYEDSDPIDVTVALWGVTDFPQSPDHHVVVEINGVELADEWFDGLQNHPIDLQIPAWLLEPSDNTIRLRLPHDTGAQYDLVHYDFYRVQYPRRFHAEDGRLRFDAAAPLFRVESLPSSEILVYRVNREEVEILEGTRVRGVPGDYDVIFRGSDRSATYYVSTVDAIHTPTIEVAQEPVKVSGEARLLILSHPDFLDGLRPLAEARRAEGYSVRVVDVRQIYQRYAGGIYDPEAIRDFIRHAQERMRTQSVLLVGGDTYDYHGYLDTGAISFLPTLYAQTDRIVRYAPVDPLYGDVDGDRVPDLAIGRLPVRDEIELETLITKILDYGKGGGGKNAVAAADAFDTMSNTSFSELSESLISNLGEDWEIERAYIEDAGLEAAREILLDELNDGVSLASYVGHSGPLVWSFQGLFDVGDAEELENVGRPSVVTQWGCWNTYFVSPTYDSLAHALLLSGDRGAAAVLGATTLTQTASETALGSRFFTALTTPGIPIGEALRDAKRDLATTQPDLTDVILGWTLLGDPTMNLEP